MVVSFRCPARAAPGRSSCWSLDSLSLVIELSCPIPRDRSTDLQDGLWLQGPGVARKPPQCFGEDSRNWNGD